jgi:hypothetical protein
MKFLFNFALLVFSLQSYSQNGIELLKNNGQWSSNILYKSKLNNQVVKYFNNSFIFELTREKKQDQLAIDFNSYESGMTENLILTHTFKNVNTNIKNTEFSDKTKSIATIIYPNIYKNIDLIISKNDTTINHVVKLNTNAYIGDLKIKVSGINDLIVDTQGNLHIYTEWGEMIKSKPQIISSLIQTEINYILIDNETIGFKSSTSEGIITFLLPNFDGKEFSSNVLAKN